MKKNMNISDSLINRTIFYRLVSIVLLLCCSACVQSENSSSQDKDDYEASLPIDGASSGFTASRAILSESCADCHPYHTMTEEKFITDGLVVAGDPQNSKIYYRLTGSTGSQGPKNMPDSSPALPIEDLETIANWITNIQ